MRGGRVRQAIEHLKKMLLVRSRLAISTIRYGVPGFARQYARDIKDLSKTSQAPDLTKLVAFETLIATMVKEFAVIAYGINEKVAQTLAMKASDYASELLYRQLMGNNKNESKMIEYIT